MQTALGRLTASKAKRDELQKQQDVELAKPPAPVKKQTNYKLAEAVTNLEGQINQAKATQKSIEMQTATERKGGSTATRRWGGRR